MKYKINEFLVFTIFSFFIFNYKSIAQETDTIPKPLEIGIETHVGSVLKHTKKLDPIETGTPVGLQFYFARPTNGAKQWHQLFNYPTYGASLAYFSMGNKRILGDALIGLAFIQFPFLRAKRSSFYWHAATGLAFCNTVYHMENNPLNQAISAKINYSIQSQLHFAQQITDKLDVKLGVGMTHISNGSIKKPNLGINIPTASIGLFYNPYSKNSIYYKKLLEPYKKDWRLNVAYHVSFSRQDTANSVIYPAHIVSMYASKRINRIHSLLLGIDGIYDTSLKAEVERQKSWGFKPNENIERLAVMVGHELTITRLAFATQVAFYVYRPFKTKTFSYQRFNIKYYVTKRFFVGSALRVHFGTADGVEIGAGVKI